MSSNFQVTAKLTGTELQGRALAPTSGAEAAREALRGEVYRDMSLHPNDGHSEKYHREQLNGNRFLPLRTFEVFLEILQRRGRRETVRRILALFVRAFGFDLVDLSPTDTPPTRPAAAEVADLSLSAARLQVEWSEAAAEGPLDRRHGQRLVRRCESVIRHGRATLAAIEVAS